jgi:hypothetical protein
MLKLNDSKHNSSFKFGISDVSKISNIYEASYSYRMIVVVSRKIKLRGGMLDEALTMVENFEEFLFGKFNQDFGCDLIVKANQIFTFQEADPFNEVRHEVVENLFLDNSIASPLIDDRQAKMRIGQRYFLLNNRLLPIIILKI